MVIIDIYWCYQVGIMTLKSMLALTVFFHTMVHLIRGMKETEASLKKKKELVFTLKKKFCRVSVYLQ